jgi:hypothetical protein
VIRKSNKISPLRQEYPIWAENGHFWRTYLPAPNIWDFHTSCCIWFKRADLWWKFEPAPDTFSAFMIEIYSFLGKCTSDFVSNEARSPDVQYKAWIPSLLVKLSKLKICLLVITPKLEMCDWLTLRFYLSNFKWKANNYLTIFNSILVLGWKMMYNPVQLGLFLMLE